jgi:hypothetical protein
MPKAPAVTRDRYKISAETSLEEMGFVVAALTKMGVQNINYELITDVRRFHGNGERKVHEVGAEEFAAAFVKENASFKAIALVKHFVAAERTAGAAYSALKTLVEKKAVKKLGPGHYQRADVKSLPKPKHFEITGEEAIWNKVKSRKSFTTQDLRALFNEAGRNEASVSPILDKMLKHKRIKRIGQPGSGEYAAVHAAKKPVLVKEEKRGGDAKRKRDERAAAPTQKPMSAAEQTEHHLETANG